MPCLRKYLSVSSKQMNDTDILIPTIPKFERNSPKVVLTLDKIRYELDKKGEDFFEFYWFAREFPRFYRYHIDNIEYRLQTIQKLYEHHKTEFLKHNHSKEHGETVEMAISTVLSFRIYWDFEALLGATNSALDILARISGVAYTDQTPVSLNKISKKKELTGIVDLFRNAQTEWINNMKDYRDCFVHYTPVDSRVYVTVYRINKNWKMWCKIPTNPNIRVADDFKFSRRVDLLRYSISVYENLMKLDKQVADKIEELYANGQFPKRTKNLFYVGQRNRK